MLPAPRLGGRGAVGLRRLLWVFALSEGLDRGDLRRACEPPGPAMRLAMKLSFPFLLLQQQDEMKRKKVMHIAQEIMSSEKV